MRRTQQCISPFQQETKPYRPNRSQPPKSRGQADTRTSKNAACPRRASRVRDPVDHLSRPWAVPRSIRVPSHESRSSGGAVLPLITKSLWAWYSMMDRDGIYICSGRRDSAYGAFEGRCYPEVTATIATQSIKAELFRQQHRQQNSRAVTLVVHGAQ
ncbi:hypothetical protein BV20DRAFT_784355 [Pilatotrama ljubarskyi]|nr:hypothetical protein BV20DRAFT_784355 [Pilatotrama ljubarskyi]